MHSRDEGENWSTPRRLLTTPTFNLSTLVRSPAVPMADGFTLLPVYQEFLARFSGSLLLDPNGAVAGRRRIANVHGTIQPLVIVTGEREAIAFSRIGDRSGQTADQPDAGCRPVMDIAALVIAEPRQAGCRNTARQRRASCHSQYAGGQSAQRTVRILTLGRWRHILAQHRSPHARSRRRHHTVSLADGRRRRHVSSHVHAFPGAGLRTASLALQSRLDCAAGRSAMSIDPLGYAMVLINALSAASIVLSRWRNPVQVVARQSASSIALFPGCRAHGRIAAVYIQRVRSDADRPLFRRLSRTTVLGLMAAMNSDRLASK